MTRRSKATVESRAPPAVVSLSPVSPASLSSRAMAFWQSYRTIIVVALTTSVLAATLFYLAYPFKTEKTESANYTVCVTSACRFYEGMLSTALDSRRKPCDDFYRFVCGDWETQNERSVYRTHMYNFGDQLDNTLHPTRRVRQTAADKAAYFFQSCVKVDDAVDREVAVLRSTWRDCGIDWPKATKNADVLQSLIRLRKKLGMPNMIDIVDGLPPLITYSAYVQMFYRREVEVRSSGDYKEYYERHIDLVKAPNVTKADLLPYSKLVAFEDVIHKELNGKLPHRSNVQVVTIQELADFTPQISAQRWKGTLSSELHLVALTQVRVASPEHIAAFDRVLKAIGEEEVHRYVGWLSIQMMASYMNVHIYPAKGDRSETRRVRRMYMCYDMTEYYMGWATFAKYAEEEFSERTRRDIHAIIDNISSTVSRKLADNSWATAKTAESAPAVKKQLDLMMYFPDTFPTASAVDPFFTTFRDMGDRFLNNWVRCEEGRSRSNSALTGRLSTRFIGYMRLNKYYQFHAVRKLKFLLPPYAALLPLYEYGINDAVKYGALGSLIASAAVDMLRRQYHFAPHEWQCLNDSGEGVQPGVIDSALTSDIAWSAYKALSPSDVRLGLLSDYSHEHLFFIAMCYLFCGQDNRDEFVRRCNGPLKHSAAFSRAFSCPRNSPMNHKTKCTMLNE